MKNNRVIIFVMLFIVFFSCRKDPKIVIEKPSVTAVDTNDLICEPLPPDTGYGITEYITEPTLPDCPTFNPYNSDEIIYVSQSINPYSYKLIKFNLNTFQHDVILNKSGIVISQLDWSRKNWIFFSERINSTFSVYKIKSNGDSLTQINFPNSYGQRFLAPQWNYSGNKFICFKYPASYSIIFDEQINVVDSFQFVWSNNCNWAHPLEYMLFNKSNYIDLYNYNNNTFKPSLTVESCHNDGDIFWLNNSEFIFNKTECGIYKSDTSMSYITRLKDNCTVDGGYFYGDLNQNKTKIVWSKIKLSKVANFTIKKDYSIVITDVDLNNEIILDLPL
jgi:hypothetical protein